MVQQIVVMAKEETGLFDAVVEDEISCEGQLDVNLVLLFPVLVSLVLLLLAFANGEEERSREEHLDNPDWLTV